MRPASLLSRFVSISLNGRNKELNLLSQRKAKPGVFPSRFFAPFVAGLFSSAAIRQGYSGNPRSHSPPAFFGVRFGRFPDGLRADATPLEFSAFAHRLKETAWMDMGRTEGIVDRLLRPGWRCNGSGFAALAGHVRDHPAAITKL